MSKKGSNEKIRRGQVWMKNDTKVLITIICRQAGDAWRVAFDRRTIKSSHKMREHDIYKFYTKV